MSISSVASGGAATTMMRPSGPSSEIREGIKQLKDAVDTGDMTAVQAAYDSLSKLQSSDTASAKSGSPLSKLIENVGAALETGDVAQVQQALDASRPSGPPTGGNAGGPQGGPPPGGPPPGAQPSEDVTQALGELGSALQSGDLDTAQSAYSSLVDVLETEADAEDDEASASETEASPNPLQQMLSDLGSALESGNLSAAQQVFTSMTPRGSQGFDTYA